MDRLPLDQAMQRIQKCEGSYTCLLCGNTYKQLAHCREHVIAKHAELEELPCSECGKIYPNKVALRHHEKKHRVQKAVIWVDPDDGI